MPPAEKIKAESEDKKEKKAEPPVDFNKVLSKFGMGKNEDKELTKDSNRDQSKLVSADSFDSETVKTLA